MKIREGDRVRKRFFELLRALIMTVIQGFKDIGVYLAYTVVQYSRFYNIEHLMLLGRVMSGKGGDTILATCQAVLKDEFPALAQKVEVMLPDENTRRVGQSAAAASLPAVN